MKKKVKQGISATLLTAMSFGNAFNVQANAQFENIVNNEHNFSQASNIDYENQNGIFDENQITLNAAKKDSEQNNIQTIQIVRGQSIELQKPADFSEKTEWSVKFLKPDGTFLRNAGYSKIKRELKDGETDGNRKAGDADGTHLLSISKTSTGANITAKNKGNVVVVAQDENGKMQKWNVEILYQDPKTLPTVTQEDFAKIRKNWVESIIGDNLETQKGGKELLKEINEKAKKLWNTYEYKGKEKCEGIPWLEDKDKAGNKEIAYEDDAVEFRPAFKKVLDMSKAYAAKGGDLYKNEALLKDITNILDYLCTNCYIPKTQTDNWWTWEIGLPKDLIPALMLISDDLTKEQIFKYTDGLYFFQPDPFMEGVIHTASTHGVGYREAKGANIIDCSTTAVGLGALREDNELVNVGMLASAQTFVIQSVKDSTKIAETKYESGFYEDGSYLDHEKVPYLGAYGVEFMKGAVKIPNLLNGTPWKYPEQAIKNIETYVTQSFANGIYNGMMLDSLKGRSVSRPNSSNRDSGRDSMKIILQLVDSFEKPVQTKMLSMLKAWISYDEGFIDSLQGVENIPIKQKAEQILKDNTIVPKIEPVHISYPLMDRAIHRTNDYLFAISMYSERIQNTEIMNHENRLGWHQNNGMTYIYDKDNQYTENYWNTVNPMRLAGTTVVPVNIGNGTPDSSGFLQKGDFCSTESWVGGSTLGKNGISGMSMSGKTSKVDGAEPLTYAPELKGKKSWFMFDNEIICLGAGISNKGIDLPVETTVENRKLNADASNKFVVNGKDVKLEIKKANLTQLVDRSADVSGTDLENIKWAHIQGTKAIGTGYYFPTENTKVKARIAQTTGDWADVGTSEGKSTQNYLEMWFDHGINPTDEGYSYVLLPETTAQKTEEYAKNSKVKILENTNDIQAVYHDGLKMTGINFWNENGGSIDYIKCDKPASVIIQQTPQKTLKIAVSDPTMKNTGSITLTFNKEILNSIKLDSNVKFKQIDKNTAALTFAMKDTNGKSCFAELKLK